MSDLLVAKRYAEALYDFARAADCVKEVDDDVDGIGESLEASRELVNFFRSPIISREKKSAVVRNLFTDKLGKTALRFILLLVEKRREDMLSTVLSEYRDLRDRQRGVARAVARSASPLTDADKQSVRSSLEKLTGKTIRLRADTDAGLVGGIIVRIDDTVYDGSVRNKLNHLRAQFASGSDRTN